MFIGGASLRGVGDDQHVDGFARKPLRRQDWPARPIAQEISGARLRENVVEKGAAAGGLSGIGPDQQHARRSGTSAASGPNLPPPRVELPSKSFPLPRVAQPPADEPYALEHFVQRASRHDQDGHADGLESPHRTFCVAFRSRENQIGREGSDALRADLQASHSGKRPSRLRIVGVIRDADQSIAGADGEDDLGQIRRERHNSPRKNLRRGLGPGRTGGASDREEDCGKRCRAGQ